MKTVVTHNGSFHPDDVFAVATLQLVFGVENLEVIRSRDEEDFERADIVADVGMIYEPKSGRFDHHQLHGPIRENGLPYAAFGLVWKEFGVQITSQYVAENIERAIVQPIDAGDNGVSLYELNSYGIQPSELYSVVSSYNPIKDRSDESLFQGFLNAVTFAREYLERLISYYEHQEVEFKKAESLYLSSENKELLVSDTHVSKSMFVQFEEVKILVAPTESEQETVWRATAIPKTFGTFETRVSFPETWGGLREAELSEVSQIEGAQFCHRGKFLFVAKTKEGAIAAAEVAIKNGAE